MRLPAYVAQHLLGHDVAVRTAEDYAWVAGYFDRDTALTLDQVTAEALNRYFVALRDRGWKSTSVRSFRTKLLVLLRAACAEGYTDNRIDFSRVRRIRVPAPNPQGITPAEAAQLIAWCRVNMRRRLRLVPVPAGDYLAALFAFLWDSGMRLGDAVAMRYEALAPTILWLQTKTGRWHKAQLTDDTLRAIEQIRTPRTMIWPRPAKSRTALYALIRRAFAGAGMVGTSKRFRQGVATDVYLQGLDPGSALGHVPGSRVAFRHYVRPDAQITVVSPTALYLPGTAPQGL